MSQESLCVGRHLCFKSFLQFLCGDFSYFCVFHNLGLFFVITSNNKLCNNRKLLGSEAQCLLCYFIGNTLNLKQDASGCNRENKTYRVALTFTHTYVCWLLSNRLVREDSNPNLSLTLHVTCNSYTSRLNLTTVNPFSFQAFNTKTSKSQLITSLSITFATTFLWSSVFSSFRL